MSLCKQTVDVTSNLTGASSHTILRLPFCYFIKAIIISPFLFYFAVMFSVSGERNVIPKVLLLDGLDCFEQQWRFRGMLHKSTTAIEASIVEQLLCYSVQLCSRCWLMVIIYWNGSLQFMCLPLHSCSIAHKEIVSRLYRSTAGQMWQTVIPGIHFVTINNRWRWIWLHVALTLSLNMPWSLLRYAAVGLKKLIKTWAFLSRFQCQLLSDN